MLRTSVIDIRKDLPVRPRSLSADAMSNVFGGCQNQQQPCTTDADCCPTQEWTRAKCRLPYRNSPVKLCFTFY
jgi:hypothetical protein